MARRARNRLASDSSFPAICSWLCISPRTCCGASDRSFYRSLGFICQSHHRRARLSARRSCHFCFLGLASIRFYVRGGHACIQLLFPAPDSHFYRRRSAELDRALRLPGHRGAPPATCRSAPGAGRSTPRAPQELERSMLSASCCFESDNPAELLEPDSPLHRGHLRSPPAALSLAGATFIAPALTSTDWIARPTLTSRCAGNRAFDTVHQPLLVPHAAWA